MFLRYYAATIGENILKGFISIKTNQSDSVVYSFEQKFYVGAPYVVISSNSFNYLVEGQENRITIAASGFRSDQLIVSSTNAELKSDSDPIYLQYLVTPNNEKDVEITVKVRLKNEVVSLGTQRFKVVKESKIAKD